MVRAAGVMARQRVTKRRSQGCILKCKKPSMTTWPAMVPVSVEDWPEESKAAPKSTLAAVVPNSGASN